MGANPANLFGVDIREQTISMARTLSPNVNFTTCNGWDIEFQDESFDIVMQFVVFSSISESELRKHIVQEMVRVLKPGGCICFGGI